MTIGAREPGAGERSVAEVHGAHVGAVGDERAGRVQNAAPVAMRDEASRNEEPREAQRERALGAEDPDEPQPGIVRDTAGRGR